MIRRRTFVGTTVVAVLATRGRAPAQPPAKPAKIGWLTGRPRGRPASRAAILEGLKHHGFTGLDVIVETGTGGPDTGAAANYANAAARLVAAAPDVIIASNPYSIAAVTRATKSIPIVAVDLESDPVARGWVASLARPGGNVTGFFLDVPELSGKQLQFLREVKPDLARVAVLGDARINELQFRATEAAAKTVGLTLHALTVANADQIEGRVAEAARQRVGALLALTSPLVSGSLERLASAAVKHRLPAICPFVPLFAEAGGLLAYGPDFYDLFRRAGVYAGRILKGAKVAELPVQRPEKFELAVNARTARELGLALPIALVQRADRVIDP